MPHGDNQPEKATEAEVIHEDDEDKEDDINLPDADVEALLQKELSILGIVVIMFSTLQIYINQYELTQAHAHAYAYFCILTHTCKSTHTCSYTLTHIQTHIHSCMLMIYSHFTLFHTVTLTHIQARPIILMDVVI